MSEEKTRPAEVDEELVNKLVSNLLDSFNKASPNIPETLKVVGKLLYHLGASIASIRGRGPSLDELRTSYYTGPTVDVGLMIQGLLILTWIEDFLENPRLSEIAKRITREEDNTDE